MLRLIKNVPKLLESGHLELPRRKIPLKPHTNLQFLSRVSLLRKPFVNPISFVFLKGSKKVKRIKNYVLKYNLYPYFLI